MERDAAAYTQQSHVSCICAEITEFNEKINLDFKDLVKKDYKFMLILINGGEHRFVSVRLNG